MNHTKKDIDAMAHEAASNFRKIVEESGREMLERFEQFAKVTIYATELVRLVEDAESSLMPIGRSEIVTVAKSLRAAIDETTR